MEISQHVFWSWVKIFRMHLLKDPFSGYSAKFSDCRAFILFETVPSLRVFSHSIPLLLAEIARKGFAFYSVNLTLNAQIQLICNFEYLDVSRMQESRK